MLLILAMPSSASRSMHNYRMQPFSALIGQSTRTLLSMLFRCIWPFTISCMASLVRPLVTSPRMKPQYLLSGLSHSSASSAVRALRLTPATHILTKFTVFFSLTLTSSPCLVVWSSLVRAVLSRLTSTTHLPSSTVAVYENLVLPVFSLLGEGEP